MASPPLIDLRSIDFSKPLYQRADIEKVIPHRGPIVQLDAIVWANEENSEGVGVKQVRDDEFWVEGHIPQRPIMPGVLMVEAAAQLASFLYYRRAQVDEFAGFTRIEDTVFRGIVEPGDTLVLCAREIKYNKRRFIMRVQGLVRDDIVFEGKITGMVFPALGKLRQLEAQDDPSSPTPTPTQPHPSAAR